ncbi:hypothetical protein ACU5AY_06460 [Rhizobium sp. PAMB 3174]
MRRLIASLLIYLLPAQTYGEDNSGRDLYIHGRGAAVLIAGGIVEVPATQFACAGCHGEDALGGREGATEFPALIDGLNPRFDRAAFGALLRSGIGADGRTLSSSMPRYSVDPLVVDSLYEYLSALAAAGRVGVEPGSLLIAAPSDASLRPLFAEALDRANRDGGAWGRLFQIVEAPAEALVAGDEVLGKINQKLVRELALLTVRELERRGVTDIAVGSEDEEFVSALRQMGIQLEPNAVWQVDREPFGVTITERDKLAGAGRTELVRGIHADPSVLAKNAVDEILLAAIACGRGVTRRCVLERLGTAYWAR